MSYKLLRRAQRLATIAHRGQKYGDLDYMHHLRHVANQFSTDKEKAIAFLHDVPEDTPFTVAKINKYFGSDIGDVVNTVTRRKGEKYFDFIGRISKNKLATRVKLADINSHLDPNLAGLPSAGMIKRYRKAQQILRGELVD